jgi:hypothetical protein
MSLITVNWKPSPKALREFGAVMLIGLGVVGGAVFWRGHREVAYVLWAFGAVSGATGLTGRQIAMPFYCAWMGLAYALGTVVSGAMLAVLFYLIITPMGLVMGLLRRDRLALRKPKADTYWCDSPAVNDTEHYERQS